MNNHNNIMFRKAVPQISTASFIPIGYIFCRDFYHWYEI